MNSEDKRRPLEDRRIEDVGPPDGWRDRRRHVERRMPKAEEVAVSDDEWEAYFGKHAAEGEGETPATDDEAGDRPAR